MNCIFHFIALLGLLAASGKVHVLGSETDSALKNKHAILVEERTLSDIGTSADPANIKCTAGAFRTSDNVCKDCPVGTWSNDAANRCCPDGQYEGLNALCEKCPAGKYLTWIKCRSKEQNRCRTCGKGKVSQSGAAVCTACTPGTYADHNANICVPCPANTYGKARVDVCTPCPLDMYSASGDAKCSKCLKGFKLNAERTGCQLINPIGTPPTARPTAPPTTTTTTTARPSSLPSGGIITTVAGDGTRGYKGDGGLATSAGLYYTFGVAVDASGNIYIADFFSSRIRLVTKSTGIITTVAGNGKLGYKGDGGPATSAGLFTPHGVTVDASGNIYIADTNNECIRLVTKSTGIITTVAGNGTFGYSGDGGPATSARLNRPNSVAVDASGNIYFADAVNHRIRMVTKSTGIITTVAGDGTTRYKGDGGLATSAGLHNPNSVAVDASGNIYIADTYNDRIRLVTKSTGIITTVAGDGTDGYKGDGGLATSAGLSLPTGIAVDASGNIYFADTVHNRIRLVTKSTGIITTVAGDGTDGSKGDGGPATSAGLQLPSGIAVDASGNIYIADTYSSRIRMVTPKA